MSKDFSHLDQIGRARMVNVGGKTSSLRTAVAKGEVVMKESTLKLIEAHQLKKGDLITVAEIAGTMAAKRTAELIPLCHPIQLHYIDVKLQSNKDLPGINISAEVHSEGKTGVEMEALTAVAIAALTVYDMAKSVDKGMRIQNIRLIEKHGGTSGDIILE